LVLNRKSPAPGSEAGQPQSPLHIVIKYYVAFASFSDWFVARNHISDVFSAAGASNPAPHQLI
jgi:hypothetical protein